VHVVGAVRHPGVQRLASGARVADAVQAAGGLLGNAAAEGVNLARIVQDGEQIVVPTRDQWAASTAGAAAGSAGARAGPGGGKVDINSADVATLDTLPGVGPTTAQRIVADREANGPFASVKDLGRVPGIGDKKLGSLKDLICVR
jgi:competence protein ComEA